MHVKGPPHTFFTFTYADQHEPYFLNLLQLPSDASKLDIKKKICENPGIAEKYFVSKWNVFVQLYLVKKFGCEPKNGGWFWYRFEWQHRGGIHVHGLYRLPDSQPDPYTLGEIAIEGFLVKQKMIPKINGMQWSDREIADILCKCSDQDAITIREGDLAVKRLAAFNDSIISADMMTPSNQFVRPDYTLEASPMALKPDDPSITLNLDSDIQRLVMCVVCHTCRRGGCRQVKRLSRGGLVLGDCRFKYPKKMCQQTEIEFVRRQHKNGTPANVEITIHPRRVNSANIACHVTEHLRAWRANTETSICHDLRRVLKYVCKYASKPETKSNPCLIAFKEVFNRADPNITSTELCLRSTMLKVLSNRDITVYEAVHGLLSLPLRYSNITVRL